ncbi:MAG: arylsulfatase, partial [Pirellulaceae bacterium]|nr:arylsulfatase [Pirellulaceae bacterium]
MRPTKILPLAAFLFLGLCLALPAGTASADVPDLPNVVIIFTDDQGYEDVGCF